MRNGERGEARVRRKELEGAWPIQTLKYQKRKEVWGDAKRKGKEKR